MAEQGRLERESGRGEKTFALSFILCALGVVATGTALLAGFSATLLADFLRRLSDSVATGIAWLVHRRRARIPEAASGGESGNPVACTVAIAFCISGLAIAGSSLAFVLHGRRLTAPIEAILPGLSFAAMGFAVNLRFFLSFRHMGAADPPAVGFRIETTQLRLYAMKTLIDGSVLLSLSLRLVRLPEALLSGLDLGTALCLGVFLLLRGLFALGRCLPVPRAV